MKNNTNQKMTVAERAEMNARIRALRTEANALARALKKDEATEEVAEEPVKAGVTEEVTETPEEEAEVTEEVTETSEEEAEVTEEVTETSEEAEVTEEVTETPEEEAEVTEEVTETSEEEAEVTEEVTETSEEEAEVTEEVTETPEEEAEVAEEGTEVPTQETAKGKKSVLVGILIGALAVCVIMICILAAVIAGRDQTNTPVGNPEDTTTGMEDTTTGNEDTTTGNEDTTTGIEDTTTGIEDTTDPSGTDDPVTPNVPAFDVTQFVNSVVNISGQLTDDENIAANANIFVENIGEDKLKELVEKHGELNVQKAIAEMLAFVPEIKMQQYVANNGLNYNPNAVEDYDANLLAADEAYRAATNKNPDGAVMSLDGYDTHKANREAIKALIIESGDTALLTWYEAKTDGFDLMKKQIRDTEAAEAYKEEVKLELANSKGAIKLLELQLEKEVSGELTVMDNVSMQYTADYNQFILNNYMYVVAN